MDDTDRQVSTATLTDFAARFLGAIGRTLPVADEVAEHLVSVDLSGVYLHGIFRLTQYANQARDGFFGPAGEPTLAAADGDAPLADGNNGFGVPIPAAVLAEIGGAAQALGVDSAALS